MIFTASPLQCPECKSKFIQSSKTKQVRTCRRCGHEWGMTIKTKEVTKKKTTSKKKTSKKK